MGNNYNLKQSMFYITVWIPSFYIKMIIHNGGLSAVEKMIDVIGRNGVENFIKEAESCDRDEESSFGISIKISSWDEDDDDGFCVSGMIEVDGITSDQIMSNIDSEVSRLIETI